MEKRFLAFCLAAMLTLYSFAWLNNWLNPPPPPKMADKKVAVVDPAEPAAPELDENKDEQVATIADATDDPAQVDAASDAEIADVDVRVAPENKRGTIGSLAKDSPYRMLVTWNNKGAAIERIEYNDQFTDLEDKSGYLGHLGLTDSSEGGCIATVVGTGTPASLAKSKDGTHTGLKRGDRIRSLNGETIGNQLEFGIALAKTKPNETVSLSVDRDGTDIEFDVLLRKRPLEIIRRPAVNSGQDIPLSYLLTLSKLGNRNVSLGESEFDRIPSLRNRNWVVQDKDEADPTVEFSFRLPAEELKKINVAGDLQIIKRYTIAKRDESGEGNGAYHINMELEFKNLSNEQMEAGFRLEGPTGLPIEGWWYAYKIHPTSFGGAGIRDIVARNSDGPHRMFTNPKIVKHFKKNPDSPDTPLFLDQLSVNIDYLAVDSQYFLSGIIPGPSDALVNPESKPQVGFHHAVAQVVDDVDTERQSKTDVTFQVDGNTMIIPPNGTTKHQFTIFAVPKDPEVLATYGLGECISYGWFRPVAKVLTSVMHFFYAICGNFGISIILLTVLVRGCLLPIGRQQALNAQRMQELAPEMKRIAEKYKDDMEKRAQAQRELFRKNNYNPLAGCLPMFLQLPIFIGLYRSLSVDIQLRQAPLIPGLDWCSNLAGPDQLWRWDGVIPAFLGSETGFLGPYLNILPLFSVGLMLVQQKLFTPPAQDEQQAMQLKMMKYMMIFFGFMFFRVPAGLCLYFITSSLWGIGERKLIPKPKLKNTSGDGDDNKSTLAQALTGAKKQQPENGVTKRKQRKDVKRKKK